MPSHSSAPCSVPSSPPRPCSATKARSKPSSLSACSERSAGSKPWASTPRPCSAPSTPGPLISDTGRSALLPPYSTATLPSARGSMLRSIGAVFMPKLLARNIGRPVAAARSSSRRPCRSRCRRRASGQPVPPACRPRWQRSSAYPPRWPAPRRSRLRCVPRRPHTPRSAAPHPPRPSRGRNRRSNRGCACSGAVGRPAPGAGRERHRARPPKPRPSRPGDGRSRRSA
mmetsp:Transcript_46819/g.110208  ORF Transcript_46819/g.110208 Transcript_46819/m.110208 type:complete len:228 (+) Transcript_46819:185-868(+)